jgi:hypothetical protein
MQSVTLRTSRRAATAGCPVRRVEFRLTPTGPADHRHVNATTGNTAFTSTTAGSPTRAVLTGSTWSSPPSPGPDHGFGNLNWPSSRQASASHRDARLGWGHRRYPTRPDHAITNQFGRQSDMNDSRME